MQKNARKSPKNTRKTLDFRRKTFDFTRKTHDFKRKKRIAFSAIRLNSLHKFHGLKFCEVLNRSHHLAGVGIFVVVPRNDFHKRSAVAHGHALRLRSVEQRAVGDADDIGRNEFFFGVAERSGLSSRHRRVYGGGVNFAFADRYELR